MSFGGSKTEMVICPFDSTHEIKGDKFIYHVSKCPKRPLDPDAPVTFLKGCIQHLTKDEKRAREQQKLAEYKQKRQIEDQNNRKMEENNQNQTTENGAQFAIAAGNLSVGSGNSGIQEDFVPPNFEPWDKEIDRFEENLDMNNESHK